MYFVVFLTCTCDTDRRSLHTLHTPQGGRGLLPGNEDTAAFQSHPEVQQKKTYV